MQKTQGVSLVLQASVIGDDEPSRPWATHPSLVMPAWMVRFGWVHEVTLPAEIPSEKRKANLGHEQRSHLQKFQLHRSPFTRYITTEVVAIEITTIKRIVQLQV